MTYSCGHPRTEENTRLTATSKVCRICRNAYQREYRKRRPKPKETGVDRYIRHRKEYLPQQLADARAKVRALENEARRYGMTDLLESANG